MDAFNRDQSLDNQNYLSADLLVLDSVRHHEHHLLLSSIKPLLPLVAAATVHTPKTNTMGT
jgi:hypothetical protein